MKRILQKIKNFSDWSTRYFFPSCPGSFQYITVGLWSNELIPVAPEFDHRFVQGIDDSAV